MTEYLLALSCPDRTGLIYAVTRWLLNNGCNVMDSDTYKNPFREKFFMRDNRPMKSTKQITIRPVPLLMLGIAILLAGAARADDLQDELRRCAQLKNPEVRLACYDALARISESQPLETLAASEGATSAIGASSPEAQVVPEQAAEQKSEPSLASRVFGMLPGGGDVKKIESRVVGEVDGLGQGTRFELENGQVWRQVDRTKRNYSATNPKVEIKEGFMNSYRMRLEGINARIRVRRVK